MTRLHRIRRVRRTARGQNTKGATTDWQRIADGRPWRVQQGVDFSSSVPEFRRAADDTAALMGKQVLITRDRMEPERFLWLQFVDGAIAVNEPCHCGGRRFIRLTAQIVRCGSCGSTMIATPAREAEHDQPAPSAGKADTSTSGETLARFSEVRLRLTEVGPDAERYVGFGVDGEGRTTLLVVRVPLAERARVPDSSSPTGFVHEVVLTLAEPFLPVGLDAEQGPWDVIV